MIDPALLLILMGERVLRDRFVGILGPFVIGGLREDNFSAGLKDLGVDSIKLIEIVTALEEGLGFTFEDDEITQENFTSPHSLWRLVSRKASR